VFRGQNGARRDVGPRFFFNREGWIMKSPCASVFAFAAIFMFMARFGPAATLVQDGRPKAVIVVPGGQKSPPALELQSYVEKASGATLNIVREDRLGEVKDAVSRVFVGPCRAADRLINLPELQPEGFVIKTEGNDLYIVGRDATDAGLKVEGTAYGVCEFLERYLGVRWLMPGKLGEIVPKRATIEVASANLREEPLLWQRKIRDSKMSGHRDRVERILKEWNVPLDQWKATFAREITEPWFRHQRLGSRVKLNYGHSYGGWWDKYHQQYPDIFAMQPDGTRINTNVRERLCVSNPTLWDLVARERIAELRADPSLTAASISPNDGGANKFCCCPQCRAWDSPAVQELYKKNPQIEQGPDIPLSDRYFRFYNEVAKRVKKELPDRFLGCYAYSVYRSPPVVLDHLEDNLIVGYVAFSTYLSDQERQQNRAEWIQWSKLAKQLILRPNLLWQPLGLPVNYVHKLADDLRFLADHGMRATDYDGLIGNWGTQGLDYYVLARLLWNPYAEVDPIIDDYCRAAYGPGAEAMKDYYRRLEELTNRIAAATPQEMAQFGRWSETDRLAAHYTDGVLSQLQACLDRACAAVGDSDPAALERIQLPATGLEYTRQTRRLLMAAAQVRAKTSTREEFEKLKREVLNYYRTLALSWAVSVDHDYTYVQRGLGLKPRQKPVGEEE
jgi:hypothetical protein